MLPRATAKVVAVKRAAAVCLKISPPRSLVGVRCGAVGD
jgi:hypothetical protein